MQTFTIGFNEYEYDESKHANAVAKHLGTQHHNLLVTDTDLKNVIPDLPKLYDEPFADPHKSTHLFVDQRAKSYRSYIR